MKKIMTRLCGAALALALLGAGIGSAGAELKLPSKSINVNTGVKIYVNGAEFTPTDSDGKAVDVFLHDGTTYLPVRAISGIFGVGIDWDNETKSVYLATRGGRELEAASMGDSAPSTAAFEARTITVYSGASIYYKDKQFKPTGSDGEAVDVFLHDGTTYLPVRAISGLFDADIAWDGETKSVKLDTAGTAQTVAAARAAVKKYTDSEPLVTTYYQYYLKVAAILGENFETVRAYYAADPTGYYEQYLEFFMPYSTFDKEFGTYMENCMTLVSAAKELGGKLDAFAADGQYSADELDTLASGTSYLDTNYQYFKEYLASSSPERILAFVKDGFSPAIYAQVAAVV